MRFECTHWRRSLMYTAAYMWGYSMQHGKEIYIVKERKVDHGWMEDGKEIYSVKERKADHGWMRMEIRFYFFLKNEGWTRLERKTAMRALVFWGILNILIREISGDERGITHPRPHHAGERVHRNCLISTSLDYHQ